jgi:predicted phage terminase large subunit-like protein
MSQQNSRQRFEVFKEQDRFLWANKRYYGYISGVGAGKTFAGIIRTYLNMQKWNEGEMGAIIAPTRQMVVNVIIPEMREMGLIGEHGPWEYKSAYSDEPGIHSQNGSRALILSADNTKAIERLRGLNLAWVWMDEEAVIDERAREIAMQRLRTGTYRNLYITTTPKGKNHTYNFFVGNVEADQSQFGEATIYEANDRTAIVGVPTSANPHTPTDYKEAMESDLPDQLRAQEVQGQFVEIGSGIFQTDMLEFIEPSELADRSYRYVVGVDVGVEADSQKARDNDSDFWAASLLMVDTLQPHAYLIDVQRERGLTLKQGIEWIQKLVQPVDPVEIYVESNQSQRWLKQELADKGLNAHAVMNTSNKEDRLIQLTIPLERGDVRFVNRDIDQNLGYDPRFQDLISEMLSFPEGSHDDLLDSLEIAVNNVQLGGNNILGADMYDRGES